MAGRHQAQFTRYASMNSSYSNVGSAGSNGNSNNLGVPFPTSNNASALVGGYSSAPGTSYSTATPTMTSPYSTTSSPGYHSPNFQKHGTHNLPMKRYTLQPLPHQQPYSKTMPSLGYPGLFPQKANQEEDIMTESNVRNGFYDRPAVSNEHTCAHDMVYSKLVDDPQKITELGSFAVDVLKRKQNAAKITGPATFKAPVRANLNDAKREQWIQELANGSQSLRKLIRNAPHGFKGEKLLETMASKHVPFLRATWYIKVVGLSEMSQRMSSNSNTNFSQSYIWTNTVINHLKRQLAELSPTHLSASNTTTSGRGFKIHPSTPNSHHDNAQRPWSSPDSRAKFEQRWAYSTQLTKWQYCEGLLDQRTFLKRTLDILAACQTFEMMWLLLTFLIQDYLDEYRRNRTLMKMLIETLIKSYNALTQYLSQVSNDGLLMVYSEIKKYIERMIQSLFLSTPDVFVAPKLYHQYRHLFDVIFGEESRKEAGNALQDVCSVMEKYWMLVKARNEIFCGTQEENQIRTEGPDKPLISADTSTELNEARRAQITEDHIIRVLDNIGRNIDSRTGLLIANDGWMDLRGETAGSASCAIFGSNKSVESVQQIVNVICRWATSESRHGDWRPYLVASILLHWCVQNLARRNILQDALMKWLDLEIDSEQTMAECDENEHNENHVDEELKPAVILLFDTFIRMELFSYQKFLLRLIARGDLEPKKRTQPRTRKCLSYLASFPLTPAPLSLVNQRRVAIYGTRNGNVRTIEDDTLLQLKRIAKYAMASTQQEAEDTNLDCLFGPDAGNLTQPPPDDTLEAYELSTSNSLELKLMPILRVATRYIVLKFTTEWLVPEVKRYVVKNITIGEDNWRVMTTPGSCLLNTRQYVAIIKILEYAKDYLGIIDVALWVLDKTDERALYSIAVDTLRKHASIWKLVNYGQIVAQLIWAKHQSLQNRGIRERCLMMFMVQLVQEGYRITDEVRTKLQHDLHFKPKNKAQYLGRSVLSIDSELNQITRSPTMTNVQNAVEVICSHQSNASTWLYPMFSSAFQALQQYSKEKDMVNIAMLGNREELFEFRKRILSIVDFIKSVADRTTLSGQLDDIVVQWLLDHYSTSNPAVFNDLYQENTWFPLFLAMLVVRRLVSIDMLLKHFVLPWFGVINREAQQRCESQWIETTAETKQLRQACKNLVILVRMLVVQEQPEFESPWALRTEEIFQIEVQRQPQLAINLDKLDNLFGLVRSTVSIVSNLPFSSSLIQELLKLRTDLLQLEWFRRACTRDVNSIYNHFATSNVAAVGGEGEIRKKMLNIVDELIGGNMNAENECRESMIPTDLTHNFGERLQAVFANLSQWNEEQCRVQLNLLLDNIMVSPTQTSNDNLAVVPMDMSPAPSATLNNTSIDTNKELDMFVKFFFDAVLSSANEHDLPATTDTQRRFEFLRNLIQGLRKPVLLALLNRGVRMLEGIGAEDIGFPYTVLLTSSENDTGFSGPQYAKQCQAFYYIMQHLLAKDVWSDSEKIELIKSLFRQVEQFKSATVVYKVMESANHASFSEASRALQQAKNVEQAVMLLKVEGVSEQSDVQQATAPRVTLNDLRMSLLLRLRLMVPFASLIWEHPKEDECDILEWVRVLVPLLGNPIVHGNGSQEQTFEFVLDLVSLLIDEVPTDLRKKNLNHLSSMHNELSGVPAMLHCRVKRILPFLTYNVYLSNTRLASALLNRSSTSAAGANSDLQQQQQHLEMCMEQSKPWEWLEDYASEHPPHDNDVPISLGLFNGRRRRRTESTYVRWYHFGFDDGLATIADDDDDSVAFHVGMVGQRVSKRRRHPRVANDRDNSTVYIMGEEGQDLPGGRQRVTDMEDGELP
ncbi:hypothetical protein BX666DRAFT_1985405 [Dichotomocladium elegans]|nr:hypothetical protein BX666DRAFT_1985405 [Dichotomocladium elegans]